MLRSSKNKREKDIARVSVVGIISNGLLGAIKIIVGIATHSVAIMTDAINNLTDTSSSIITIVGTHLATRHPDAKHPFGYGRIEYLTSLVIGLIVFFTGVEMCKSSIDSIIHPDHVDFTVISAVILAATVVVKIFLGAYTLKAGKRLESGALVASGMDARSDAVATGAALFAAVLYLWKGISIDAWVGALISLYIVRTGFEILKDTVSKMIGEAPSQDLVRKIRHRVLQVPEVKGAYDLVLNSYGPDLYIGSMNVEVDHTMTAEEICVALHPVQQEIFTKLRTVIVFGLYAVNRNAPFTPEAAKTIAEFCRDHKECLSFHALFVDRNTHQIFCDLVVDYGYDPTELVDQLSQALKKVLPDFTPVITADAPAI